MPEHELRKRRTSTPKYGIVEWRERADTLKQHPTMRLVFEMIRLPVALYIFPPNARTA